jgi:hypothetical protein
MFEHVMKKYYEVIFGKTTDKASAVLLYLLEERNLRLLPEVDLRSLRILLDKEYISSNNTGVGTWMDWNYERSKVSDQSKQPLNNYVLVHALPSVRSRFRLAANVYFILYVELRIQK